MLEKAKERANSRFGSQLLLTTEMGKELRGKVPDYQLILDRFVHKITKEKEYEKPGGCCGGILADEMGMDST